MREITHHKGPGTSELNSTIKIVADDRDENGGSHQYQVTVIDPKKSPEHAPGHGGTVAANVVRTQTINFQCGPVLEAGLNGISDEALIAIVIDRIEGFQEGPTPNGRGKFCSRYNACAKTHFEEGLMWLQKRTRDRAARGVEGTSNV